MLSGCSYDTEPMKPSMRLGIGYTADDQTARWQWEQAAGQFTLLEVTTPGSETLVRLATGNGKTLSLSRVPQSRSAPFFICAESENDSLSFELELKSIHRLGAQAAAIIFYSVPEDSYANKERAHGLRKLCSGLSEFEDGNAEALAANLQDLAAAEKALTSTGESERALWARYLGIYFQYVTLNEYQQAVAATESIIDEAEILTGSQLMLLAQQLKGQAALDLYNGDATNRPSQLQKVAIPAFEEAVRLAQESGNRFEEARALNNWGKALDNQDNSNASYEKHAQALKLIKEDPETYLENRFREDMSHLDGSK